ncbi:GNAT family N-acetyltransferase [Bacillus sp. AK031]
MRNKYKVVTLKERLDLKDEFSRLHSIGWVKFMREDPIGVKNWGKLLTYFPEFQFLLLNEDLKPVACGNSIPFKWDGNEKSLPTGWDGVLEKGIGDFENNVPSNSVSALAIVIHPEYRGQGLSDIMVREMKGLVTKNKLDKMVAPVRPSLKSKYPLIPMEEYIMWKREDGTPFDPWIRTHCRTGASIIKVAAESMVIPASVETWENWIDMELPSSGAYIIKEGLVPLKVDKEADVGTYIEPNVWLEHQLT